MNDQQSRELFERLLWVMPGANTRTVTHYEPFPLGIARGKGCRIWDLDGNSYIDFVNNYTVLVHGHAAPPIVEAIAHAASQGTVFPAPTRLQAELAERICVRTPSIERLRFCNSGSEAVLMAVRAARAFTGRDELIMPRGGYHGCWEQVSVELEGKATHARGVDDRTLPAGVPAAVAGLIHFVDYNDISHLEELLERHGSSLAALILEPVLGHVTEPGEPDFIRAALRLAHQYGALLILDEVVTSRLCVGGWQAMHEIQPDLTTLGKTIGGGLPIGAFGGREDVMAVFDPRRDEPVPNHGTFSGNSLSMAAGCTCLDMLDQPAIDRINSLGGSLVELLGAAAHDAGVDVRISHIGSLLHVHTARQMELHRACLEQGLYIAPRGSMNVSTAMDDDVIDEALMAWKHALDRVAATSSPVR